MQSVRRRYETVSERHPEHSSYINFAKSIQGQGFTRKTITKWFSVLVDVGDYESVSRNSLIRELTELSDRANEAYKQETADFKAKKTYKQVKTVERLHGRVPFFAPVYA
jgi:hypothetical protein